MKAVKIIGWSFAAAAGLAFIAFVTAAMSFGVFWGQDEIAQSRVDQIQRTHDLKVACESVGGRWAHSDWNGDYCDQASVTS